MGGPGGFLMDIIIGLVGALAGGFLMSLLGFKPEGGLIYTIIVAVIGSKGKVSDKTILEANFEQAIPEYVPDTPAAKFMMKEQTTVRDVVDAIDRAAEDDRVVGMVAKIGAVKLIAASRPDVSSCSTRTSPAGPATRRIGSSGDPSERASTRKRQASPFLSATRVKPPGRTNTSLPYRM